MTGESTELDWMLALHHLNPSIRLHWRQFGTDWVVFDSLSGQTHQMPLASAAVLMCFESGSTLSTTALLETLGTDFGIPAVENQAAPLRSVLDQLAALGLIIRVATHAAL